MNRPTSHQKTLSPTEFTLLGLIARAEVTSAGPVHGYDLARQMPELGLSHVIHIEPGMMYHYLKKLAKRGMITATVERQEGRPDRHTHTLTEGGRAVLDTWMVEPVVTTREIRLEFLLKLWFARQHPERAMQLIRAQREIIAQRIASLRRQRQALPEDDRFAHDVLSLRESQNLAIEDWLDHLEMPS
jgi:DNA-binding PadR family transcriptional regulator